MEKELKDVVARYVEKVGVEHAVANADKMMSLALYFPNSIKDSDSVYDLIFHSSVLEYLFAHEDEVLEKCKKIANNYIDDN